MNQTTQIAEAKLTRPKRLVEIFADRYKVDPKKMMVTLKNTAFRQQDGKAVTDEQMMALMVVANQYHLNPFTKEIYAFPDKGGIVPIVGIDGWSRLLNENEQFDGMKFEYSGTPGQIDGHHKPCPESITCIIYRKDREHPTEVTEYLDEVYKPPFVKNKGKQGEYVVQGPWQSHTKRMLRHKAMMQCARIAMGFTGIYDQDEAERIVAASDDYIEAEVTVIEDESESSTERLKRTIAENTKPASQIDQPEPKAKEPYIDPETGDEVPDDVGIDKAIRDETPTPSPGEQQDPRADTMPDGEVISDGQAEHIADTKPKPGSYKDVKDGKQPPKKN